MWVTDESKTSDPERKVLVNVPDLSLGDTGFSSRAMIRAKPQKVKSRGRRAGKSMLPPEINGTITCHHVFRYRASAQAANSVSIADMLLATGAIATTTTQLASLSSAFLLHKVTIWPSQVATADVAFVEFAAAGSSGYIKDDEKIIAIPDGITVTEALVFTPPKKSLAADWISSGATTGSVLFNLTCQVGAIIDVDVSFTVANALTNFLFAVASATVGKVYFTALDGVGTNNLIPVGLLSTH